MATEGHPEPDRDKPTAPPPLSSAFARWLRGTKQDLLAVVDGGPIVLQPGAAHLAGRFTLPPLVGHRPSAEWTLGLTEPIMETFVVEHGRCTGTGGDQALVDAWRPTAEAMVAGVTKAMEEQQVSLEGPAYLTASLTPLDQVTATAHVDDDRYIADDGVGLVAIAASHCGPRIATEPVPRHQLGSGLHPSGLPMQLEADAVERFQSGAAPYQQAEPDRIVIFTRFGQLHAGPVVEPSRTDPLGSDPVRRLLVFRADTRPAPGRTGA